MTERELSRVAAHRLAIIRHVEEVTGNVALTWRAESDRGYAVSMRRSGAEDTVDEPS